MKLHALSRGMCGALGVLLACALPAGNAQAQAAKDYPSKPVRVIVPYSAGGPMDFIGQVLGQKLKQSLGQNFYIDNRAGAGGAIGTDTVAKAAPDGYTILLSSSSHASLPSVQKSLPYNAVSDFAPITLAVRSVGSLMTVYPGLPAANVTEFIRLAKAQPGKLTYGSGGIGNVMQFAAESFNMAAGTQLNHVPYKGVSQALTDLVGGRIDVCFMSPKSAVGHVRGGRLRALALAAPARWNELPEVPTMAEAGLKNYTHSTWYGFWFPAGTPPEFVARIRAELARALEDPATQHTLLEQALVPVGSTSDAFAHAIAEEIEFNRKLVPRMGITPQ